MKNQAIRAAAACFLAVALAACGGGGGGAATPTVDPSIANANLPRIEPYERAAPASLPLKRQPIAVGAIAADVGLGAPEPGFGALPDHLAQPGAPRKIGQAREISALSQVAGMRTLLRWQPTASGGLAAATRVRSNGAASLRLALQVQQLPASATVRVFGAGEPAQEVSGADVLTAVERDARGIGAAARNVGIYWLPTVAGDVATLEIELPAGVNPSTVEVAVPRVLHQWVNMAKASDAVLKIGNAGSCNVDATCVPDFSAQARSVARMEFVKDGESFGCTGTLMADAGKTGTPYFFSANHCVNTQAAASTLITYWFFQATACNSGVLSDAATQLNGGATLLYASAQTDASFMRLLSTPPAGVYFAGSLLEPAATGSALSGLHYPFGDLLKLSLGSLRTYASCEGERCSTTSGPDAGNFMALVWTSGTTELGSSGSAALVAVGTKRYVTGQLFAGRSSCAAPDQPDYYGRFDLAYKAALRQYLGTP